MTTSPTVARWNVRIVRIGEHYGLDNCRTYGHEKDANRERAENDPLVEFYDITACPDIWGEEGYFVSRYYLSTLLGGTNAEHYASGGGLCLDGGDPDMVIEGVAMKEIVDMLAKLPEAQRAIEYEAKQEALLEETVNEGKKLLV